MPTFNTNNRRYKIGLSRAKAPKHVRIISMEMVHITCYFTIKGYTMASNYDKLERLVKTDNLKALDKDQVFMAVGRAIQNFEHKVSCQQDDILMKPDLTIVDRAKQNIILEEEIELTQEFIQDLLSSLDYFKASYPHSCVIYPMEEK